MTDGIAGHVNKLSVDQFVIAGESVWQALELLNRNTSGDRHTDYYEPDGRHNHALSQSATLLPFLCQNQPNL
jgi:hypothetical protein